MTIRSFVLRQGRMTDGQERAFETLWPTYGVDIAPNMMLDAQTLFGRDGEFVLEIGFGNGETLVEMAKAAPETGFLGIEVHRPGVGHAMLKAQEAGVNNLRIVRHDAVEVLRDHIADNSLSRVQIYFPDPWPKARHHKRRLVQTPFTDLLWRKLRAGGEVHCATDWENYAFAMREVFQNAEKWRNVGNADGFADKPDFRPQTKFERRGLGKGHSVWDLRHVALKTGTP